MIADAHKAVEFQTEGETITATVTRNGTIVTATSKGSPRAVRTSALGASDAVFKIRSVKPFHVDVKCPLELTTSDRVLLPVTLTNVTSEKVTVAAMVGVRGPLALEANATGGAAVPMDVDARKE